MQNAFRKSKAVPGYALLLQITCFINIVFMHIPIHAGILKMAPFAAIDFHTKRFLDLMDKAMAGG